MDEVHSIVFGEAPSAVELVDRRAAYAVIKGENRKVAAVSAYVCGRDQFWLPGGGMHVGESPEQTIIRELREELDHEVNVRDRIGQALQFFYAGDDECWYRMSAHFYIAEFAAESDGWGEFELRWVDPIHQAVDFFHECHVWATRQ